MKLKTFSEIFLAVTVFFLLYCYFSLMETTEQLNLKIRDLENKINTISRTREIDLENCTIENTVIYDIESLQDELDKASKQVIKSE